MMKTGPRSDRGIAKKSLGEEKKAVRDYGTRERTAKSPALKDVLRHNRGEEKQHARALKPFTRESR